MIDTVAIIVGIDPGTTAGVAIFDFEGSLLVTESRKGFSRAQIRKFIREQGSPLIIASDMNPLPRSVDKIASFFSTRTIFPDSVLKEKDKRRLVRDFLKEWGGVQPWKNHHEKDAIVAGWYAWKRIRVAVAEIDKKIGRHDSHLRDHALKQVLLEDPNVKDRLPLTRVKQFLKGRTSIK